MGRLTINAHAKINLTLDVLGKRPDGYHEVEMIMQSIDLHDVVFLEEIDKGIDVTTDHPLLGAADSNIAYRAAQVFIDTYGIRKGVKIHINKNIPVAAGLAGGSTDAAAVLNGLNSLWNMGLGKDEIAGTGALIGSDVPFCVNGGTALARGRGETLSSLPDAPEMWLVLAKPMLGVSTEEIYQNFDPALVRQRPQTSEVIKAIHTGDISGIIENMVNVLETVTLRLYPEVRQLKKVMKDAGIYRPLMSGSGPSVFGIAENRYNAEQLAVQLKEKLPGVFVEVSSTCYNRQQELTGKG